MPCHRVEPCEEHGTPDAHGCIYCHARRRHGRRDRRKKDEKQPELVSLSKESAEAYRVLLGREPHDRQDAERIMAEKDLRHVDKGDRQWTARDEMRRWKASGRTDKERGPLPRILREQRYFGN